MKKQYKYFKKLKDARLFSIKMNGVMHKIDKKYKMKNNYAVYW